MTLRWGFQNTVAYCHYHIDDKDGMGSAAIGKLGFHSLELSRHAHSFFSHWNAAIVGLVCRLLAEEGHWNLQTYCPQFYDIDQLPRRSH